MPLWIGDVLHPGPGDRKDRFHDRHPAVLRAHRPAPRSGPHGRRPFTDQDVEFLQLLRCLRYTGMPVAEMLRFVELLRSGEATREERVDVLREHEARVASQIERLKEHQDHIRFKIELYSSAGQLASAG